MRHYHFMLIVAACLLSSGCEDCTVDPDLIPDLATLSPEVIRGEPVDLDYIIASVQDNSEDCEVLGTAASLSQILITFFEDEQDQTPDPFLENQSNTPPLAGGQTHEESVSAVFSNNGIYPVEVEADINNDVAEREEGNNLDNGSVTLRAGDEQLTDRLSPELLGSISRASLIVVVGEDNALANVSSVAGVTVHHIR